MVSLARLLGLGFGFLFGVILHEYAHAKVADLLGDRYPRLQGRLTLKPKAHADPVGTIAMPLLFTIVGLVGQPFRMAFGYGKPMEHNIRGLKRPKRDQIMIAIAGPAANLILAVVAGFGASRIAPTQLSLVDGTGRATIAHALLLFMAVNVFILVINAIPIPPLDGSRVLAMYLSPAAAHKMQEYAQYLVLFLIVLFLFLQGVINAIAEPLCRSFSSSLVGGCPLA